MSDLWTSVPVVQVPCRHCDGTGSVPDVSQWPPKAVCPGCKGAGVHLLTAPSPTPQERGDTDE